MKNSLTISQPNSPLNILIVIPGLNESAHLSQVFTQVKKYSKNIIFVDDGSVDTSTEIAESAGVHVLRHRLNLGKGAAIRTGCEYAFNHLKADAVIFFDADLQHQASELDLFITQLNLGHQVVFGQRAMGAEMPLARIITNRMLSLIVMLFFHRYVPDIPCGFKAISKSAFQQLNLSNSDYGIELEIAAKVAHSKLSFQTVEVSTVYHEMDRGMTFIDGFKVIWYLINLRFSL